jgi:hypothetical protein
MPRAPILITIYMRPKHFLREEWSLERPVIREMIELGMYSCHQALVTRRFCTFVGRKLCLRGLTLSLESTDALGKLFVDGELKLKPAPLWVSFSTNDRRSFSAFIELSTHGFCSMVRDLEANGFESILE